MEKEEIKELLEDKYREYCRGDFFVITDPIQIPKLFEQKEDIEKHATQVKGIMKTYTVPSSTTTQMLLDNLSQGDVS